MNRNERSVSIGTVIGIGFIVLGFLNLFAFQNYKRTHIHVTSRIPGILFILTGITIIIIRTIRKNRE
jgi:multisubunit Na+/H+ antiporter MnhG subunit